jgi:hypothetical protein
MNRSGMVKHFALSFALVATPAVAGGTGNGSAGSGLANHGNGADIPQYRNQADAEKLCKGDTVVWGSSAQRGVFFAAGAGPAHVGGFYACMTVAQKAGYQIIR